MCSSTSCASLAKSSLSTGRPWQALPTPLITLARMNASATPERIITLREALSNVVKSMSHDRHSQRKRIAEPSSSERESTTRHSSCRQNGQCIVGRKPLYNIGLSEILPLHIVALQPVALLHIVNTGVLCQ